MAGNQSEHAKWDIFKLYGVINITYFPNYSATTRCCFLFNSDKGQQIIEMTPLNLTKFWSISLLRNFHVTCPNPKHSQGMVPTGVALKILDIPCSSGYITYLVPFYPRKEPGTTLALGTKIAHGNISAELLIEWMETYKFLGVDKVVTYYVDDLEPSALKVLQYYASEGSFLDLHFYIPAATGKVFIYFIYLFIYLFMYLFIYLFTLMFMFFINYLQFSCLYCYHPVLIITCILNQIVYTRGIWKVLSMVYYLSNRCTNLIMFGIILMSYLSSMLWHKFHEDIIMQTRKILLWIHVLFVYWKTQNFSRKYNILPFEKCAEH